MADSILLNVPTKSSNANVWIAWHKGLKSKFGKKNANLLFLSAFEKRGDSDDFFKTLVTEEMADYFKGEGITLEQGSLSRLKGVWTDTSDFFSDVAKAGMITTFVVGGVLVLSVGIFVINIARTANAGTLTNLARR